MSLTRFLLISWFLAVSAHPLLHGQAKAAPELVEYVRDARKAGLNEAQIHANAVKAGWADVQVIEAIAAVRTEGKKKANATPDPRSANSATPAVSKEEMTAGTGPVAKPPVVTPSDATPVPVQKHLAPVSPTEAHDTQPGPRQVSAEPTRSAPQTAVPSAKESNDRGVPDNYEIGAGDVLHISVWKEPDASVPSVVVRPDGRITVPLLKEVHVVGLTPTQVEKQIAEQLSKVIAGADVTVVVVEINSKKIYMLGAVKKEGPISYTYRMSAMQAISEAGGLTDYAKRKKIYILRHENGTQYKLPFDYDAVLKGLKMELNVPLLPGDTVVVPH